MKYAWAFLFISVVLIIGSLNPDILNARSGDNRRQFLERPVIPVPFVLRDAVISGDPKVIMYREDLQRTGITTTINIHAMARPLWRLLDFNIGNHGASKSTPLTDGEAIYLGSDRGFFARVNDQGKVDWRVKTTAKQGIHGNGLIVDENIYWGDYDGVLYSAKKETGSVNWLIDLGDTIGSSPLYFDGSIVVSVETFNKPNGFLARVDARTGAVIWLSDFLGGHPHSSPALSEDFKTIYVGANSNTLFAIDFESGQTRWTFDVEGPIKGTPAVWENNVYFSSWDGNFYKIDGFGKLVWKVSIDRSQSSATFSKSLGLAFVSGNSGKTFAIKLNTGEKVWEHSGVGPFLSSPVLVIDSKTRKEALYANCLTFSICQFDPKMGRITRQYRFDSRVSSVPLIHNGKLFVAPDSVGGLVKWY